MLFQQIRNVTIKALFATKFTVQEVKPIIAIALEDNTTKVMKVLALILAASMP